MEKKPEKSTSAVLEQKLKDLQNDLGDEDASFVANFAMNLPFSANVPNVNNDPIRERAFQEATKAGVLAAREYMIKNKIEFVQPTTTYFPKERIKQTPIPKKYEGKKLSQKKNQKVPNQMATKNRQ